ncbi:MAG: glycosyltransferase [Clostridia bacterium]|nr:glycosyltransferase [Clostridia bacterium]
MKLISVLMSVYNETEDELSQSIESILCQTYSHFEFIIINDNPENQRICAVLQRYGDADSRIKLFPNEENIGLVASLNRGWKLAQGEFIARMDADDISTPDRFEKQLAYMEEHRLDFIGSNLQNINEAGEPISSVRYFPALARNVENTAGLFSGLCHPAWLMKRQVMDRLNGYRNIYSCEDYDFILRALAMGFQLGNCQHPCLYYRIRTAGISRSNYATQSVISYYLAKNRHRILQLTFEEIQEYMQSPAGESYRSLVEYRQSHGAEGKPLDRPTRDMLCKHWRNPFYWKFLKSCLVQLLLRGKDKCKEILKLRRNGRRTF